MALHFGKNGPVISWDDAETVSQAVADAKETDIEEIQAYK